MWDGVDRRKFARAEYPCLITVRKSAPPPEAILTHTADISVGGVHAVIAKKIEIMTEVNLEIDLKDTLETIVSKGTVSRVKEIAASQPGRPPRYDIAVQFVDLNDEDRRRIQNIVEHLKGKS